MKRFANVFFLIFLVFPLLCYSKSIEIVGSVVALELNFDGHSYPKYKIVEIPRSYLVVRIDESIKSTEDSKYILVSFMWHKGGVDFIDSKNNWNFKLSRNKVCDSNLKDLQYVFFGPERKSGILPRMMRIPGFENETLPFDSKLPCYDTNLKKMKGIPKAASDSTIAEDKHDSFVLEDSLWLNPSETPLKIFFGRLDEVENTTKKPISEFKFGCVSVQNNVFQIKHSFEVEKGKVPPKKKAYLVISNNNSVYMDELYQCYQLKSKVATIWVKFEDNSVWELK